MDLDHLRYLAARKATSDSVTHVSVMVGIDPIFTKKPVSLVEIVVSESMDTGMVTVDADAMTEGIDATGTSTSMASTSIPIARKSDPSRPTHSTRSPA